MTIEQMVTLLGRDRTVLIRHVNNAIKEGELSRDINVQNLHNIQTGRGRPELVYDLDIHFKHERRNAHAEAARRQDEVFGCIPHGRGAYRLVASC